MLKIKRSSDWNLMPVAVAAVVSFLYYWRFLDNFFVYDDYRYIENIFTGPRAVILGYNAFRVISNAIWVPLYFLSGFEPFGYNLFNVTLYFANSVLLYFFILKLFNRKDIALLVSTIFVTNGVAADAVFWKMSGSTLIQFFFYLTTLYTYVTYRQKNDRIYFISSILLFALAMFSKEEAASLPFIILLIDILFFEGLDDKPGTVKRVVPYAAIIILYILVSNLVFYLLNIKPETAIFFKFRPLYSLFGGFSVFFLNPAGSLEINNPLIYITAFLIPLSFIFTKERKILLLGYGWILFTFLPQSLSAIGRFDPVYIFNSISRSLYLPSVGSAIVIATILTNFKERLPSKAFLIICVVFFSFYISLNYNRVQVRGEQWRRDGQPMKRFLYSLKKVQPTFPQNSYVHVVDGPVGRAYIQQSLRAFYKNPKIYWVNNPQEVELKEGDSFFIIFHNWGPGEAVKIWKVK